jgi:rubrerythrin
MYTLRCGARGHMWESENMDTVCPECDAASAARKRRAWQINIGRQEQNMRMRGMPVSSRERICENATCGKPLRGYSYRDYDPVTGEAFIVCDECGHEHPMQEMEPSQRSC